MELIMHPSIRRSTEGKKIHHYTFMEKNGKAMVEMYTIEGDGKTGYIMALSVQEKFRERGLAKELLQRMEEKIRQQGYKYACLWVEDGSWMKKWYQRGGYSNIGDHELYPNHSWMRKELNTFL